MRFFPAQSKCIQKMNLLMLFINKTKKTTVYNSDFKYVGDYRFWRN